MEGKTFHSGLNRGPWLLVEPPLDFRHVTNQESVSKQRALSSEQWPQDDAQELALAT